MSFAKPRFRTPYIGLENIKYAQCFIKSAVDNEDEFKVSLQPEPQELTLEVLPRPFTRSIMCV